jgi:hypothetical protein
VSTRQRGQVDDDVRVMNGAPERCDILEGAVHPLDIRPRQSTGVARLSDERADLQRTPAERLHDMRPHEASGARDEHPVRRLRDTV